MDKKQKKQGQKRKGLGGLSPEKRKLLKQLIMKKASEEMRAEMQKRQKEKDEYLQKVLPVLKLDGLNKDQSAAKVKELYQKYCQIEEDIYDLEFKVARQDVEMQELTLKCNDVRGKYVKPVLKKVTKSEKTVKAPKNNPDWRENLKPKTDHAEANAEATLEA